MCGPASPWSKKASLSICRRDKRWRASAPLEAQASIREAIWTLDMIGFVFPDLQLIVAGAGPDERRLRRFAGHIPHRHNVHFLGTAGPVGSLLSRWTCAGCPVWYPSGGGASVALGARLQAVPSSRPIRWLCANVVRDGETGLLAPPGDKVALGRCTRSLLLDLGLRHRLAETAKRRVGRDFAVNAFVDGCLDLYRHVA